MDNGVLNTQKFVEQRYKKLKKLFPDNIECWKKLICKKLFINLALKDLDNNFRKCNSNRTCLGCKLAMDTSGIIYCLENDIQIRADGYTSYQSMLVEQASESFDLVKKFDEQFGIKYINPVYHYKSKVDVKEDLLDLGLYTKSLEKICGVSSAYGKIGIDIHIEDVIRYTKDKLYICEIYIKEYFEKRSKEIENKTNDFSEISKNTHVMDSIEI